MAVQSRIRRREASGLGIICLIFSLVHTPLPQPDFHNIRHHHGPGEICEHHDHLLRWHPGAGAAEDVALLHWHWFMPTESDGTADTSPGPALHAHVPDWVASTWDDGPRIEPDRESQRLVRAALGFQAALPLALIVPEPLFGGPRRLNPDRAPAARRPSPITLVERWLC